MISPKGLHIWEIQISNYVNEHNGNAHSINVTS